MKSVSYVPSGDVSATYMSVSGLTFLMDTPTVWTSGGSFAVAMATRFWTSTAFRSLSDPMSNETVRE